MCGYIVLGFLICRDAPGLACFDFNAFGGCVLHIMFWNIVGAEYDWMRYIVGEMICGRLTRFDLFRRFGFVPLVGIRLFCFFRRATPRRGSTNGTCQSKWHIFIQTV